LAIAIEQIHLIVNDFVHWSTNKFHQANQINLAADNTLFVIKTDSHEIIQLVKYTQEILHLFRTDSHEIVYPVWDREDKNHTLSSGTSPCRPYKGVTSSPNPPPFPGRIIFGTGSPVKIVICFTNRVLVINVAQLTLNIERRTRIDS